MVQSCKYAHLAPASHQDMPLIELTHELSYPSLDKSDLCDMIQSTGKGFDSKMNLNEKTGMHAVLLYYLNKTLFPKQVLIFETKIRAEVQNRPQALSLNIPISAIIVYNQHNHY